MSALGFKVKLDPLSFVLYRLNAIESGPRRCMLGEQAVHILWECFLIRYIQSCSHHNLNHFYQVHQVSGTKCKFI